MKEAVVALVSGGAKRVGRAIALELARRGYRVLVHYRHSSRDAERTVQQIEDAGGHASALRADLSSVAEIEGLFGAIAELTGHLDLLVHNASTYSRTPLGQIREADFAELIDSNLKAPLFMSQFAVPLMQGRESAQIVNVLDATIARPAPDFLPYACAKAGLQALTVGLARALAPGIRVNAVAPGPVLLPEPASAAQRRRAASATLLGRIGSPEDVAQAVAFLATGPRFITGAVLPVDGGAALA